MIPVNDNMSRHANMHIPCLEILVGCLSSSLNNIDRLVLLLNENTHLNLAKKLSVRSHETEHGGTRVVEQLS